ncbi:hypothetical protein [Lichenicoccus sp.]|uniref:hypothetical protein n=1 Tax=Lichenicoccus sp. TaxID=2781899 RepID=UPI003D0DA785
MAGEPELWIAHPPFPRSYLDEFRRYSLTKIFCTAAFPGNCSMRSAISSQPLHRRLVQQRQPGRAPLQAGEQH